MGRRGGKRTTPLTCSSYVVDDLVFTSGRCHDTRLVSSLKPKYDMIKRCAPFFLSSPGVRTLLSGTIFHAFANEFATAGTCSCFHLRTPGTAVSMELFVKRVVKFLLHTFNTIILVNWRVCRTRSIEKIGRGR